MDDNKFEIKGFDDFDNSPEPNSKESEFQKKYEEHTKYTSYSVPSENGFDEPSSEEEIPPKEPYSYSPDTGNTFFPSGSYGKPKDYNDYYPQNNQVIPGYMRKEEPVAPLPPIIPKPPKSKTRVSVGSLIACTLAAAIIGGAAGTGGYMYYTSKYGVPPILNNSSQAPITENTNKKITIQETSESLIPAIAEKVNASVVGIRTTTTGNTGFWGNSQSSTGEGSGIIYKSDGFIITNYHVVQNAVEASGRTTGKVEVFLSDNTTQAIPATVVGYDIGSDLAVLKIDKTGLTAIDIGDSTKLKVGETAIAVGNPGGLNFMGSVSAGIISGLNRTIQLEYSGDMKLIQTDAAINPGNSGGALVNSKGQLIGVNSSKMAADGFEGMGFAIPVNSVVEICQNIIDNKDAKKAYIGLQISTVYTSEMLKKMGYPSGVVIEGVVSGGPCDGSGIQRGDILTKIGDTEITSFNEYNSIRNKYKPGDVVELTIYRNNKYYTAKITMGESNS